MFPNCIFKNKIDTYWSEFEDYSTVIPKTMASDGDGIITLSLPKDAKGTVKVYRNGVSIASVKKSTGNKVKINLSKFIGKQVLTFEYS